MEPIKRNRYRKRKPGTRHDRKPKTPAIEKMKPGADPSLIKIFKRIGVPEAKPFTPDAFQEEAVEAIRHEDCLVSAPTGSGKTWIAEQATRHILAQGGRVWYATPLKALTNSIHAGFCRLFSPENVGILTGDKKENGDAPIIIGTTEILRNQLYDAMHTGEDLNCHLVILDEAHFIGDAERGVVWEEIIIYLPVRVPLLLLSATIGNPDHIAGWIRSIRGRACRVIQETKRPVPLVTLVLHPRGTLLPFVRSQDAGTKPQLHKQIIKFLKTRSPGGGRSQDRLPYFSEILKVLNSYNLLPAIFFMKSRADCDQAVKLCTSEILFADPERRKKLCQRIDELTVGVPHLADHRQRMLLEHTAAGSHHSGQLPAWKVLVETLMSEGLLDAMFATSTVAAGVNFPARSVVLLNSDRFNGTEFLSLSSSEYHQMTGRSGRRGMDSIGFAILLPGKFMDLRHLFKLTTSPPQDVQSQIRINFSMVLNLLLSHSPETIRLLLEKSFASHMINRGRKGAYAREAYGEDMEYLWEDFQAHLEFLKEEAFVTPDGRLTDDGKWASSLRIDSPLLVAQALRYGLFPEKDPALMAGIMAAFVSDKEFDDDRLMRHTLPKKLISSFLDLRKGLKPFAEKMLAGGFDAPNLYLQPAAALVEWAGDTPWEMVVSKTGFADGDLARLILRTSEHLRQLAGLTQTFPLVAASAQQAIDLVLKEPITTFMD